MSDVKCPYCGAEQDICHDDGYGYEEGKTYEQECVSCEKIFAYTTEVSFYYSVTKAPCKNGGEHKLVDLAIHPSELGVGRKRCEYCDEIVVVDEEAHKKAVKELNERLKNERTC